MSERGEIILNVQELHLSIGYRDLFTGIDFSVHSNDRLGLVGRNGAGKSTLLKILAEQEQPTSGDIAWRRGIRYAYLAQDFELDFTTTVKENVYLGAHYQDGLIKEYESLDYDDPKVAKIEEEIERVKAWETDNLYKDLRDNLCLPPCDRDIETLSGGERRRVALAKALIGRPDFLILDEPTNHLDIPTIQWLEEWLRNFPGAIILITHDRFFLDNVCNGMVELLNGKLFSYEGNYSRFLVQKEERETNMEVVDNKRKQFLKKEIEWIRRAPKARGTKSQSRVDRFNEAKHTENFEREKDVDLIVPRASVMGNIILNAKNLSKTIAGKKLFENFNIEFEEGKNVGIVGRNGLGKSTLLKTLIGQLEADTGSVRLGDRTVINYFDQLKADLDDSKTVLEEITENKDFVQVGKDQISLRSYLRRFLFTDERINTTVKYLSGGEKSRLMLAKQLKDGGNFLILDEPTNDLDLQTLRVLEEALIAFEGVALIVSHDRFFLNRTCSAMIAFEGDGVVTYQDGDYDYYLEKKAERDRQEAKVEAKAIVKEEKKVKAPKAAKKKKKLSWKEQNDLDSMEENVLELDTEIEGLEAQFQDPDFFKKSKDEIAKVQKNLDEAKTKLDVLYARWEELEALQEEVNS